MNRKAEDPAVAYVAAVRRVRLGLNADSPAVVNALNALAVLTESVNRGWTDRQLSAEVELRSALASVGAQNRAWAKALQSAERTYADEVVWNGTLERNGQAPSILPPRERKP